MPSTLTESRVIEVTTNHSHHSAAPRGKKSAIANAKDGGAAPPPKSSCGVPLLVVLLAQCLLVAAVFVVLIVVVTLQMTSTTKDLVRERITADLRYSKGSILEPIDNAENVLMAHRLRYISISRELGFPLCSADNVSLVASRHFFRDALATVYTHNPSIGWVYVTQTTNKWHHPVTGDLGVSECSTSVDYMFTNDNMVLRTSDGPVTVDQTDTFEGVTYTDDNTSDFRYEGYVVAGLEHTDFGWWPYLWIEPNTGKAFLLIGGFAPMLVNRTLANGTIETYQPDLTVPKDIKKDPTQSVVSTIAVDLLLSHVNDLIASITPPASGAHSSLYDLNERTLLATSVNLRMMDPDDKMWVAGHSGNSEINEAFLAMNPPKGVAGVDSVTVLFKDDRVLSSIHITTTSDIDFIILQSTPIDYYLGTVYSLRTLMIALGVSSAVVVVFVCVAVVVLIRRSIAKIEAGMLLAAVLKNDQVAYTRSLITEIDGLCLAFARMNAKLGAARAFMPQSMLMSSGSDEEHAEDEDDASTAHTHPRTRHSDQVSDTTGTPIDGSTPIGSTLSKEKGQFQLQSKKVTILYLNTRGFHQRGTDNVAIGNLAADLTSTIHSICTQQRGVIDSFHGDHYVLSFNAARYNAQGPQMAVRCGLDLIASMGSKVQAFSIGISTGKANVGHLGSTELKRFSIIGKVYSQSIALERICKHIQAEGLKGGYSLVQLVTDESVSHDVEHSTFLQVLGKLEAPAPSDSGNPSLLYAILGSCEITAMSTDEWLYEVKDDAESSRFDPTLNQLNKSLMTLLADTHNELDIIHSFKESVAEIAKQTLKRLSLPLLGAEHGANALARINTLMATPSFNTRDLTYTL